MSDTFEILKATRSVKIGGEVIEIRELSWMELRTFTEQLAGELEQVGKVMGGGGDVKLQAETAIALVKNSQALSETLLCNTTGKSAEWVNKLSCGEFMGLLDQSLDLQLSVVTDSVKKIGGRLRGVFGSKAAMPMTPISPK